MKAEILAAGFAFRPFFVIMDLPSTQTWCSGPDLQVVHQVASV